MGNRSSRNNEEKKITVHVFVVTCENVEHISLMIKELESKNAPRCSIYDEDDHNDGDCGDEDCDNKKEIETQYLFCVDENININDICKKYHCKLIGSIHRMTVDVLKYNNRHQIDYSYCGKEPYVLKINKL